MQTDNETGEKDTSMQHSRDPLHGIKLTMIMDELLAYYGWDELGKRIPIRCFTMNPSISSSLKFLRKTPWAREKVEALYLAYKAGTAAKAGVGWSPSDG